MHHINILNHVMNRIVSFLSHPVFQDVCVESFGPRIQRSLHLGRLAARFRSAKWHLTQSQEGVAGDVPPHGFPQRQPGNGWTQRFLQHFHMTNDKLVTTQVMAVFEGVFVLNFLRAFRTWQESHPDGLPTLDSQ